MQADLDTSAKTTHSVENSLLAALESEVSDHVNLTSILSINT